MHFNMRFFFIIEKNLNKKFTQLKKLFNKKKNEIKKIIDKFRIFCLKLA